MTTLILTRHGETLENQQHILQGQLPGTLSPLGLQQAAALAERLRGEHLDAIVCSDLARSLQTAATVAQPHRLIPEPTPLLREMDWGPYTGNRLDDVDWRHLPPGTESIEQLFQRAAAFIRYLQERHAAQRVLAVGHGVFNRAITTYLQGKEPLAMIDLPIMENTACLTFEI